MRPNTLLLSISILTAALVLAAAEKKPWKDATIQVGDIKMHYIDTGVGDRNIVFVPGWTMTAEVWREQIPYFSSRGFRVIAFDPRSQGQTTKTEEGNTYHQQAADLHAFLKALKLERLQTTLVGWSAGVSVLLDYLSSPETSQPERLVLVDGFPMMRKEADYPSGLTPQQARTEALRFEEDRTKATDQFVRGMFKSKQNELTYKELSDGALKTPTGTAMALYFDLYTADRRPALSRIGVPTLVLVSSDNRVLGEDMRSKIQNAKLEVVENAGHALFLEKPQTFNQMLETFLGAN
jgi:non-heme chloroperoxidase